MTYRQLREAIRKLRQLEINLDEAVTIRDQLKFGAPVPAVMENADRRIKRCNDSLDQEIE